MKRREVSGTGLLGAPGREPSTPGTREMAAQANTTSSHTNPSFLQLMWMLRLVAMAASAGRGRVVVDKADDSASPCPVTTSGSL